MLTVFPAGAKISPKRGYPIHDNKLHPVSARGVMVIVVGNGHGDTSSNPG